MLRYLTLLISLMLSYGVSAQDYSAAYQEFLAGYKAAGIPQMDAAARKIIAIAPDNYAGYALTGYVGLLKNDTGTADSYIKTARAINPMDFGMYTMLAYQSACKGNMADAQAYFDYAFQIKNTAEDAQSTIDDLLLIQKLSGKDMSAAIAMVKASDAKYPDAIENSARIQSCLAALYEGKPCSNEAVIKAYFKNTAPVNKLAEPILLYHQGIGAYNSGNYEKAKKLIADFLSHPLVVPSQELNFLKATACYYQVLEDEAEMNYNGMYLHATKGLGFLQSIPHNTLLKGYLLKTRMLAENNMGKTAEALATTQQLLDVAVKINDKRLEVQANNSFGNIYIMSLVPGEKSKAISYLEKAYKDAVTINDPALVDIVSANYSIALWQAGRKQEAFAMAEKQIQANITAKKYPDAQLAANNAGFMYFISQDYTSARNMFKRAVDITENYRKGLKPEQQLTMMNEHSSAYGGLIMCYQKQNDPKALFEAQDLNRSRLLREKLKAGSKTGTLEEAQRMLKPNEVLLYYSLSGPGEMIVNVVTQNGASIAYNYPIDSWLVLKKKFINRINKVPSEINGFMTKLDEDIIGDKIVIYATREQAFRPVDFHTAVSLTRQLIETQDPGLLGVQQEFLRHWYDFLLKPVESSLAGKKTIIISGEGVLNYLPFEAFINASGQYLVENYNVKYIPSVTVWAALRNRNYGPSRKSLLAMGGATYGSADSHGSVREMADLHEIQNSITQKINTNNNNLKKELAALGFGGANYLEGTLIEVQNLGKVVPDATILINTQMKESDIKRLNASGELAKYKCVHIATHGFALDNIPELSGVMMTQPPGGDGNEDTFLLAHEIAGFKLNADLAVLSACETALGKIYGGEGINGLNSALLTAGANATLLSLWPVDDAGTMVMMTELYHRMFNGNMSVEDAVNSIKRDLLNGKFGERLSLPGIWAPFVHYGQ